MSRFSESDAGKIAELLYPYKGYKNAMLVKYWSSMCKWEVEVCGSGKLDVGIDYGAAGVCLKHGSFPPILW